MEDRHTYEVRASAPARAEKNVGGVGGETGSAASGHREPRRLLSLLTSAQRKEYPVATGFIDYFPDAAAAVAHISYRGNQKHNPGQPLHWARGKSSDHTDCLMRHLVERGAVDTDGAEHLAQVAWRAMADLQEYLEKKYMLDLPRGATAPGVELPDDRPLPPGSRITVR